MKRGVKVLPSRTENVPMTRVRHLTPLLVSVVLIFMAGALAVGLTAQAAHKAESIHLQDRKSLQSTLGSLGQQYVLFSLKEGLDYASTGSWDLTPNDPADTARLQTFVTHAVLLNYGVALVDLGGHQLSAYTTGTAGLPPASDPGYAPMIKALLAQKPDVSSVMTVGGIHVVAMGVPVTVDGTTKAVFVGYVRLDTSALESYVRKLHNGQSGRSYVVDSTGTVVAATDPTDIGRRLPFSRAVSDIGHNRTEGFLDDHSNDVVSVASFGIGGWGGVTSQSGSEFYGALRSDNLRVELAILALLVIAGLIVLAFNHRRETARRRFQAQLAYQAAHDGLTGLFNRSVFHERLNQSLARARRISGDVAVLYLDLDLFKPVNDQQGHEAGDTILAAVAERLLGTVRVNDTVARMGGDEFAILLEDVSQREAVEGVARRIVADLGAPVALAGGPTSVGVSIGISYSSGGAGDAEAIVRDADLAMYRAKDAGGSRFEWAGAASQPAPEPVV